jgi:putative flippase GtrA
VNGDWPIAEYLPGGHAETARTRIASLPGDNSADICQCHGVPVTAEASTTRAELGDGFHRFCVVAVARLPLGLNKIVAPTFLGYVLLNGCTFGIDLLLLTALHGALAVPLPIAVTLAYVVAFALSYILNRTLNFQSHGAVGPQVAVYVAVVVVNYVAFILGVSTGLSALGVEYHCARILAGVCEAVYMYSAMRWVVFRR